MNCPSSEQLEDFVEERVGDAGQTLISRHIEQCPNCQLRLDDLTGEMAIVQSASWCRRLACTSANAGEPPAPRAGNSASDFLVRLKQNPPSNASGLSGAGRSRSGRASFKSGGVPVGKFPVVANYEIIGELGRGGMGVVYKARQMGLDRLVALKMILAGRHAGPKDLARFRQEAEAVARLRHPNIIQIYDIGESEGRPYLALEFVEGTSLAQFLQGTPQPLAPAARLVETLAGAMHYAHQRNIVHRDLKPANILLQIADCRLQIADFDGESKTEEQPAPSEPSAICHLQSAIPRITDFGLAKRLDDQTHGTHTGDVVGTPSYMAPEQAGSTGVAVGPVTDVYALGAILYELLTGRPPFRGPTSLDTVLLVLHEEPVRPSFLRRDLPRDLETITLKCLSKEPAKRYASAEALAEDLYLFRKGKPIKARPVGPLERAAKWARHRPLTASLIAGMFLTALLGFAGVTWQWQQARIARDDMQIEREGAEDARIKEAEQRKKAGASLYFSRISQSQLQWRANDFLSARQSLTHCVPAEGEEDHRGWEWHYLQGLFHNDLFTLVHESRGGKGGCVAYDPAGARIATVVSGPPSGEASWPARVKIWDAGTGELMHAMPSDTPAIHRLAYSPDGKRLALAAADGTVMVWDPLTGQEIVPAMQMHERGAVTSIAFSPDGQFVVSGGRDMIVKVWNAGTGAILREFRGHKNQIQSVAFHPHHPIVASASWDNTVKLWDIKNNAELRTLRGHKVAVYCVAFSPDGKSVVSAGGNGNVKIWDMASFEVKQSLTGDAGAVLGIAYSPDGRYLAKAGKDGSVRIWHLATGIERMSFRGHAAPVESVHFSPDCRRVVSLSPGDGVAKVWDFTRHPEFATFARLEAAIEAVAFTNDGKRLLSASQPNRAEHNLQIWDGATGMLLEERSLPLSKDVLSPGVPVSFSTGGKYLAGRSQDPRIVKTWDTASGAEAVAFRGHTLPVACVRFSGDGRYLATCGNSAAKGDATHEIKVWDAASGKSLAALKGKGRVFNIAFSPQREQGPPLHLLAWAGQDGAVALVDWKSNRPPVHVAGHYGDVSGLVFSSDGKLLASAGMEDRTVKIWNVDRLLVGVVQPVHVIAAPSLICDLAFSPNGKRLAAISRDMVKLWEVEGGHEVLTLRGAPSRYWDPVFNPRLAFSPDGTQLAGTNWDESLSVWEALPLDSEKQYAEFQKKHRSFADRRTSFWHLQEAELCLLHNNFTAVQFHLARLQERLKTESLSEPLRFRRDSLQEACKKHSL